MLVCFSSKQILASRTQGGARGESNGPLARDIQIYFEDLVLLGTLERSVNTLRNVNSAVKLLMMLAYFFPSF